MGVSRYKLGYKHGKEGVRELAHRNGRGYDSRNAQSSYLRGYADGRKKRRHVGLDYNNPLNNRLFVE